MQLKPDWWQRQQRGKDGITSVRWAKFITRFQPGDMGDLTGNASRRLSHFQNVYDVQSINIISPRDDHHFPKVKLAASALIRESCTKSHICLRRLRCGGVGSVKYIKKKRWMWGALFYSCYHVYCFNTPTQVCLARSHGSVQSCRYYDRERSTHCHAHPPWAPSIK